MGETLKNVDIVISMLPAIMHVMVAKDCIALKKDLVTASYVSPAISDLDTDAKEAGVLLLNEMGLDPGIDHMSAMQVIDKIKIWRLFSTILVKSWVGINPPEDIVVKAKLNESRSLIPTKLYKKITKSVEKK